MKPRKRDGTKEGGDHLQEKWIVSQDEWASRQQGTFETPKAVLAAWLKSLPDDERQEFLRQSRARRAKHALKEWEEAGCPTLSLVEEFFRRRWILSALGVPESINIDRLQEEFEIRQRDLEDWTARRGKGFARAIKTTQRLEVEISALELMERERPKTQPRSSALFRASLTNVVLAPKVSFEGKRFQEALSLLTLLRRHLEPLFGINKRRRGRTMTFVSFLEETLKGAGLSDGKIAKVLKLEGLGDVSREEIRDRRRKKRRRTK